MQLEEVPALLGGYGRGCEVGPVLVTGLSQLRREGKGSKGGKEEEGRDRQVRGPPAVALRSPLSTTTSQHPPATIVLISKDSIYEIQQKPPPVLKVQPGRHTTEQNTQDLRSHKLSHNQEGQWCHWDAGKRHLELTNTACHQRVEGDFKLSLQGCDP
ncbi:hypothetical protein P7K49_033993 [Saguinus oedipus]|uniref:Uncharacterized protein n=1 Tax=Saguinus oedipus TaxID=9490 RepID=A0ABQ9TTX7_SAGOE|nr:hypothetical protein P7K49_033993 [Saguinus oedipus]